MGPTSRRVGESTRTRRREKVGIEVMGTRICTCKVGDGLGILRKRLTLLKGLSIKVLSTMLDPLLNPMMFLMDLLVRFVWKISLSFSFFDWVLGNVMCLICLALGYLMRSGFVVFCLLWFFDLVLGCLG